MNDKTIFSGNAIVDPLALILKYSAPSAGAGVIGLAFLWRRGMAKRWDVSAASGVCLSCTIGLTAFGVSLFWGYSMRFSDCVWWLKPFGALLGF